MTYVKRTSADEPMVDLYRLTCDLAALMGGKDVTPDVVGRSDRFHFTLDREQIGLSVAYRESRVQARISAPELSPTLRLYGQRFQCERISFDPDARPLPRIVSDLIKRLVNASQDALKAQRDEAMRVAEQKVWIESQVPVFEALGFRTTISSDGDELGLSGHGVSGRIQPSRTIHVERFSSLPLEKFKRIAAILAE